MNGQPHIRVLAWSARLYGWLLRAYPTPYREEYGREMTQVFGNACQEAYARGGQLAVFGVCIAAVADSLVTALDERLRPGWSRILDEADVRRHAQLVGWLYVAVHGVVLVAAASVHLAISMLPGARSAVTDLAGVLTPLAVLALPGAMAGLGVLMHRRWGRRIAIIVATLELPASPIGTALGLYALWVLLQDSARHHFAGEIPHTRAGSHR